MDATEATELSELELAQLITRIESRQESVFQDLEEMFQPEARTPVLGITGPPGVGKSTLVDGLIGVYRDRELEIAVVAVDPSSPKSGGAILGDRVRMQRHSGDEGVFIRSMSSRGELGGLNSSIYDVVVALQRSSVDLIVLETVGVGQGEVEVSRCADLTSVVLVPAYGDSIQMIKAGLQEVADLFVINKTDKYDPEKLLTELRRMAEDPDALEAHPVSGKTGEGLEELADALLDRAREKGADPRHLRTVHRHHLNSLLRESLEQKANQRLESVPDRIENPYRLRREIDRDVT